MNRAGLTRAYAVGVRHKAEYAQQQATEQAFKDPQDLARDILAVLPTAVATLPRDKTTEALRHICLL